MKIKNQRLGSKRPKDRELGLFCKQLSMTLATGVSMTDALELSGGEIKNKVFGEAILGVRALVKRGNSLSASMTKYGKIFPEFLIQMVHSGEISGCMDQILESVGDYYENQAALKSKLINTILYPTLVIVVALGVVIYLMIGVLPVFAEIFESMGAKVPLSTAILMGIGQGLRHFWPILILLMALVLGACRVGLGTEQGKLLRDRLSLVLPWLRFFVLQTNAIRFAEALSVLTKSGINMLTALETVSGTIENRLIRQRIEKAKNFVQNGGSLSGSLERAEAFDKRFYQMIRVGEGSGTLDKVLEKIAVYYNEEVSRHLKRLTIVLEPMVLLFVGGLVFFVVASVMQPVFGIYAGYSEIL